MRTTKQTRRYAIDLPAEAMDVLRVACGNELKTPEQEASLPPMKCPCFCRRYKRPTRSILQ